MSTDLRPAELDSAAMESITTLEQSIGSPVVAYQPDSPFATLSAEQVSALQSTEQQLGVQLLAYRR